MAKNLIDMLAAHSSHHAPQRIDSAELDASLGLKSQAAGYVQSKARLERIKTILRHGLIRFGLPKESLHLADAIDAPNEPTLRNPHNGMEIPEAWKKFTSLLRMPKQDELPLVEFNLTNRNDLVELKRALPELLESIGIASGTHRGNGPEILTPIPDEFGEPLSKLEHLARLAGFAGDESELNKENLPIDRQIHRQMSIYLVLGNEWTLINPVEGFALYSLIHAPPRAATPSTPPNETKAHAATHTLRLNKAIQPPIAEIAPFGLIWTAVTHPGHHLPKAYGGPSDKPWVRWEPQFPKTQYKHTSLFAHPSGYFESMVSNSNFRNQAAKSLLRDLLKSRSAYEKIKGQAKAADNWTPQKEAAVTARLIFEQYQILDHHIARWARR